MVSRERTRIRGRTFQHRRVGRLDARAAARGVGHSAYNWQTAFVITGIVGLAWVALWLAFYNAPDKHPGLSEAERNYIIAGQEKHLQGDGTRPSILQHSRATKFLGHRPPTLSCRSDLGHADVLDAALSVHGAALRLEADRAVRLDAISRRGFRLHVWRSGRDVSPAPRRVSYQCAPLRLHFGRVLDDWNGVCGRGEEPLRGGRADEPWRFRAPDAFGHSDHDVIGLV